MAAVKALTFQGADEAAEEGSTNTAVVKVERNAHNVAFLCQTAVFKYVNPVPAPRLGTTRFMRPSKRPSNASVWGQVVGDLLGKMGRERRGRLYPDLIKGATVEPQASHSAVIILFIISLGCRPVMKSKVLHSLALFKL